MTTPLRLGALLLALVAFLPLVKLEDSSAHSPRSRFLDVIAGLGQCADLDPARLGIVYFFLPNRVKNGHSNSTVFKLNNFYSLLLLSRLFKRGPSERILVYYVRPYGEPTTNHYNQWLNDSFWSTRMPASSLKFVELTRPDGFFSSNVTWDLNMYKVIETVKTDAPRRFDNPARKEFVLFLTSDMIIGPAMLRCFVPSSTEPDDATMDDAASIHGHSIYSIQSRAAQECYQALHVKRTVYSFLYKLILFHTLDDFSGALVWHVDFASALTTDLIQSTLIKHDNVYKCHYKHDIIQPMHASSNSRRLSGAPMVDFAQTYCVFGYEFNAYDVPLLENAFAGESYFNRLVRHALYGDARAVSYARTGADEPAHIPNVVHLVWFGEPYKSLKFIEFLAIKSIISVLRPERVKLHGDVKPYGELWQQLEARYVASGQLEWVQIERPTVKYGQDFSRSPVQHLADITRLEILYNEGGIYSDLDILWVKPLDELRRLKVDLIASNDITSYCNEFPLSIQIGAFLAPPRSEFVRQWIDLYRRKYHLFPGDYAAVSMCEPYKLYEKAPGRVFVDNRLQMIFFNGWNAFIPRWMDVEQERLADFNRDLDFLRNGSYGYHLPRYSQLFSRRDFDQADESQLPIRIAAHILGL